MCLITACLLPVLAQDAQPEAVLAKFGLKPTLVVQAVEGRATVAEGQTIELVAVCDFNDPRRLLWDATGRLVDRAAADLFWSILDDRPANRIADLDRRSSETYCRELFESEDKEKPELTVGIAFRLSANLTKALDPREDVDKKIVLRLASTRPVAGSGDAAFIGEARVLRPVLPKDFTGDTFDYRLEVPGGEWVKLAEFAFGEDTKLADGLIDAKMRWQPHSDFRMVDERQTIVDYKGYYFTLTLPPALREMELEIVTNDPKEDAALLPPVVRQHIRGEDQGEAFKGKDLFLVYGLNSRSESRRFTLRARTKRVVEFRGLPFRRGR
jgi:hypothetical protein